MQAYEITCQKPETKEIVTFTRFYASPIQAADNCATVLEVGQGYTVINIRPIPADPTAADQAEHRAELAAEIDDAPASALAEHNIAGLGNEPEPLVETTVYLPLSVVEEINRRADHTISEHAQAALCYYLFGSVDAPRNRN